MKLMDFIKTGPCEVTKEKFDAAIASLQSLQGRMDLIEFKQIENRDRLKAHLDRIEQAEIRFHNLFDKITKLELAAQAGFRELSEKTNELSLRIERVAHRLEAHLDKGIGNEIDETDL